MKKLYRRTYIDASCQVWFNLAKKFQKRRFVYHQPIRNKNCSWQPYLLAKRNETKKLMLPAKFGSIWPSSFRGEDLLTVANQKQELPLAAIFVGGTGRNKVTSQRTLHRCFLPSFTPFGQAVSEEIFLTVANQKQELPLAAIFAGGMGRNEETLQRTLHRCFLPSLVPFGTVVSEEKIKM